ncbi:MAG TPA: hypothetical protein VLQ90_01800 [Pyrinomonadaceae bacterium]|nr:hypothetical protein [Pyrinomonadaceae bacterium]
MKLIQILVGGAALLFVAGVQMQTPDTKHFDKDGLSFDYPAKWQMSDQSTQQMQLVELSQGDVVIRVRSPREWLKTPEKEAHAKKLFQDDYVDSFATQVEQAGMHAKRSAITTQIAGADAEGIRLRAVLDGAPGGMDSYFRIVSDRLVNLSIIASEKEISKSAAAWDTIRNSLKVEPPPQPKPSPSPKKP